MSNYQYTGAEDRDHVSYSLKSLKRFTERLCKGVKSWITKQDTQRLDV